LTFASTLIVSVSDSNKDCGWARYHHRRTSLIVQPKGCEIFDKVFLQRGNLLSLRNRHLLGLLTDQAATAQSETKFLLLDPSSDIKPLKSPLESQVHLHQKRKIHLNPKTLHHLKYHLEVFTDVFYYFSSFEFSSVSEIA